MVKDYWVDNDAFKSISKFQHVLFEFLYDNC